MARPVGMERSLIRVPDPRQSQRRQRGRRRRRLSLPRYCHCLEGRLSPRRQRQASSRSVGALLRQFCPESGRRLDHGEEDLKLSQAYGTKESRSAAVAFRALHGQCTGVAVKTRWQLRQAQPLRRCHQSLPRPLSPPSCRPSLMVAQQTTLMPTTIIKVAAVATDWT